MSASLNAGLRTSRSVNSTVSWLSSASASARSRVGLARTCATTRSVRSLSLADTTSASSSALASSLDHHSLDDTMLDERAGDGFRQGAREDAIDDLLGLGRREHILGHPLEPAPCIDAGAAPRVGKALRLTAERGGDR